jgi:hypothetical protein
MIEANIMRILVFIFLILVYQEIYGSGYKFPPPLARKKGKRTDMRVTFSSQPIILNESFQE